MTTADVKTPEAKAAEPRARNWFIVHTYSGFEERVRQNLKQRVEAMGMADAFGRWQGQLKKSLAGREVFETAVSFARTGKK